MQLIIRLLILQILLLGCILESEEASQKVTALESRSVSTTVEHNPDLQPIRIDLFFYVPAAPPTVRIISPSKTYSNITTVELAFSGLTIGDKLFVYSDATCLNSLIVPGEEIKHERQVVRQYLSGGDGEYNFYARIENGITGSFSACYDLRTAYVLDTKPPGVPKVQLHSPLAIREKITDIELIIKEYEQGIGYQIYFEPTCQNLLASGVLSGTQQILPVNLNQGDKKYEFYVMLEDPVGNLTDCLKTSAFYTLDTTPPDAASVGKISPVGTVIGEGANGDVDENPVLKEDMIVNIKFEDLFGEGELKVFQNHNIEASDFTCDNQVFQTDYNESELSVSLALSTGDGSYDFNYILVDDLGNESDCLNSGINYIVDTVAPSPPLQASTEILEDTQGVYLFFIKNTPVEEEGMLFLYLDNACSEEVGGYAFDEERGYFFAEISSLSSGTVEFFGKYMDQAGNISDCSEKLAEYELSLMVSGVLTYDFVPVGGQGVDHDKTEVRPMRGVIVDLLDVDPASVSYNQTISSTTTNDFGSYTFFLNQERRVKVIVRAELIDPPTIVINPDANNARYTAVSNTFVANDVHTVNLHAESGWGNNKYESDRSAAPFAILDSIYSAYKKITDARPDITFTNTLWVNWGVDNTEGAYYMPNANHLFLKGKDGVETDEFDRHLVIHEWGHYFENNLSRSDSMGGSHGVGDTKDMSLSFGEGFATALAAMTFEPDAKYVDTFFWSGLGSEGGFVMDVEHDTRYPDTNPGWFSELSVQQILYDVVDVGTEEYNEPHDNLALGIGPVLDIMTGNQITTPARTSIFTFITYLKELFPELVTEINELTDDKTINTIQDIWGSNSEVYSDLYPDFPMETFSIYGGYLHNDAAANRHIRFRAISAKTKFTFVGDNYYLVDVSHNGVSKHNSGYYFYLPNEVYEAEIDTVIGDYYSIKLYTDKQAVSGGLVSIQVRGESL